MKKVTFIIFVVFFMLLSINLVFSEEKVSGLNWYSIQVQKGTKADMFFGTSKLSEEEMMTSIKNKEAILLSNLVRVYDKQGKFITEDWNIFLPMAKTKVCINSEYIIYVLPLKGNPKDFVAKELNE